MCSLCNKAITKEAFDYEGVAPSTNRTGAPFLFYVYVDNVDDTFAKALHAGMKPMIEPEATYWGDRRARLQDAFGYVWDIAKRTSNI